jgi:hypothetical protein
MAVKGIKARNAALARHLGRKLDVPGDDMATLRARAGRLLPGRLGRAADDLVLAETMAAHPKLRHLVDRAQLRRDARMLRRHVQGMDPAKARKDRFLGQLAGIVFGLLVFFAALVWFLAWRGMIGPGTG